MNKITKMLYGKENFKIYVSVLSFFIFLIVLVRAATTAITWDEAYTYMAYAKDFNINQLINIHSNFANNHILNTIMIAIVDKICNLPYNEFLIRLPNIIMLIFYFLGSYKISKSAKHKYLLFSGLVLNYYVMEFFGLARGYGIATSLVIWMCYYFQQAVNQNYDDKNIIISIIFGLLACYANTVSILALFAIGVVYLIQLIKNKEIIAFIKRNFIKIIPLLILLIYIIIFHFIVTGANKPVFGATGEAKGMTFIGFLEKSFVWMFIENTMINIIFSIIGIIAIIISAVVFRKQLKEKMFFNVMLILLLALIIPFIVLHKPYLIERCLIPLWPILVLGVIDAYTLWTDKMSLKLNRVITCSILLILLLAFIIRINIKTTRTWENNYIVRDIAYQTLFEHRALTQEEYEKIKGFYGLDFYRAKILEQYNFDIVQR